MSEWLPIIAAVASTIGALWAGNQLTRRLSKFGLSTEQLRVQTTLRELAEVESAKRKLLEADNQALRDQLSDTRHDLDDCARQRDNAYSELRGVKARRTARTPDQ